MMSDQKKVTVSSEGNNQLNIVFPEDMVFNKGSKTISLADALSLFGADNGNDVEGQSLAGKLSHFEGQQGIVDGSTEGVVMVCVPVEKTFDYESTGGAT